MRDKYIKQHEKSNGRKREELAFNGSLTAKNRPQQHSVLTIAADDARDIANGIIPHTHMRLWALLQNPHLRVRGKELHQRVCSRPGFIRFMERPDPGRRIWTIQFYGNTGRIGTGDVFELVKLDSPEVRAVMRPFGSVQRMVPGASFVPPGALTTRYKARLRGRCMGLIFGSIQNNAALTIYEANLNDCLWAKRIWRTMMRLHASAMALP